MGSTAASDKLLQRLALGLGWPVEWVRLVGWLLCVGLVTCYFSLLRQY